MLFFIVFFSIYIKKVPVLCYGNIYIMLIVLIDLFYIHPLPFKLKGIVLFLNKTLKTVL